MLFDVKILGLKKIYDMPGTWSEKDYRQLLNQLEVEGIDDLASGDVLDFLQMALQDLEPEEAADQVLAYKLRDSITAGARQNIVQDLLEGQRPWEEAADIRLHSRVFAASLLLYKSLPGIFPKPDMMELKLQLQALEPEAVTILSQSPQAAFVTRVLADGMDKSSILERLFDEQLAGQSFPEAQSIIWMSEFSERDQDSALLTVYSSQHWLEAMEAASDFKSNAYNDRARPEEDEH